MLEFCVLERGLDLGTTAAKIVPQGVFIHRVNACFLFFLGEATPDPVALARRPRAGSPSLLPPPTKGLERRHRTLKFWNAERKQLERVVHVIGVKEKTSADEERHMVKRFCCPEKKEKLKRKSRSFDVTILL